MSPTRLRLDTKYNNNNISNNNNNILIKYAVIISDDNNEINGSHLIINAKMVSHNFNKRFD